MPNFGKIDDNYTKLETEELLNDKANVIDVYSKINVNTLLNDKVDKITGKDLSTNDFDNTYKGNVDANTANRHTHSNKNLLDTYNQSNEDLTNAVNKKFFAGTNIKPSLIDNLDGSITIGDGQYTLYNNDTFLGEAAKYNIVGNTFILTDNTTNYIIANYNLGTPVIQSITNVDLINESDIIPIYTIYRNNVTLNILQWDEIGNGLANKLHQRLVKTNRFAHQSGLYITETTNRNFTITSGIVWHGGVKQIIPSVDTSVDSIDFFYHSSGNWTSSSINQYNNSQYDNGTDLVTLSNNKYVVNWIYKCVADDKRLAIVLGNSDYTLQEALNSSQPSIPTCMSTNTMLIGRIIIQKGLTSGATIQSVFDVKFAGISAFDHKDLLNIGINTHSQIDTFINNQNNLVAITKETTGFYDYNSAYNDSIDISYNPTTRKVTLTNDFAFYYQGNEVIARTSSWTSPAHDANPTTPLFLKYNGSDFVWTSSPWAFYEGQIIYINYDSLGVFRFGVRETHGLMQWQDHKHAHETTGTYKNSGGVLLSNSYVINSTIPANRRPDVDSTTVSDEDLRTVIPAKTDKLYTQLYLSGANGDITFVEDANDIVPLSTNQPYYNQFTGGIWKQTLMTNNQYMCIWQFAIPTTSDVKSQKYRYFYVQGQSEGTLISQQGLQINSLNLSGLINLSPELVPINKIIIRYTSGNWELVQIDTLQGVKNLQISSPAGNYLSSVFTDHTLSGNGNINNPLEVNKELFTHIVLTDNAILGPNDRIVDFNGASGKTIELYTFSSVPAGRRYVVEINNFSANTLTVDLGSTTDTVVANESVSYKLDSVGDWSVL